MLVGEESPLRSLRVLWQVGAFVPKLKGPSPPSPSASGLNPLKRACEKESVANHNPFFTVERNSIRQIEKWPYSDREWHWSASLDTRHLRPLKPPMR